MASTTPNWLIIFLENVFWRNRHLKKQKRNATVFKIF